MILPQSMSSVRSGQEFTGNEVALDRSDRALLSRPEEHAPVEDEMVLEAANQLASELAETLKAYAR